jgi:hypothetical protein
MYLDNFFYYFKNFILFIKNIFSLISNLFVTFFLFFGKKRKKSNQKKKRNPDGRAYGPRVGTFSRPVSRGILRGVVVLNNVLE